MPKLTKEQLLTVAKAACESAERELLATGGVKGACIHLQDAHNLHIGGGPTGDWRETPARMQMYFQPWGDDRDRARTERNVEIYCGNWMDEHDRKSGVSPSRAELAHQRLTLLALFYSAVEAGIIKPEDN